MTPRAAGAQVAASWYVVTCRLEYADEDSCHVLQARDKAQAVQLAEAEERSGCMDAAEDEPRLFYLNYVVSCGECKPEIVETP